MEFFCNETILVITGFIQFQMIFIAIYFTSQDAYDGIDNILLKY